MFVNITAVIHQMTHNLACSVTAHNFCNLGVWITSLLTLFWSDNPLFKELHCH